ncbi:MAG TPA: hypothetical protein VH092_30145 [Urbifossiella sp.]|jgi:CheY-like chemotaxis protein|nr:hypothetical protein [Urbifossiella sp.]
MALPATHHPEAAESTAALLAGCGIDALLEADLLDIGLPGMTGWDVARRLRGRPPGSRRSSSR